jgi:hypothetical protein
MNVTVTVPGDPIAPIAVTVMCPVLLLGASAPTTAEIVNVCGAAPLAGETISHGESLMAVKLKVPAPLFVTFTIAAGGFVADPVVPTKDSVITESFRAGATVIPPPPPPHPVIPAQIIVVPASHATPFIIRPLLTAEPLACRMKTDSYLPCVNRE